MFNSRIPALRNQALIGIGLFGLAIWAAWQSGGKIAAGDTVSLVYYALGFAGCVVVVAILRNWRAGFFLFFVWLMFEDLARKFMGNEMVFFFGKDILLFFVYISLFVAIRSHKEKAFRPPFLLILSLFVWLGVLQIFNQNSPHILYGLLGFKVYFYYIPLMWVGYALIRNDLDLRRLLMLNAVLATIIAGLGIAQAILGNSFLNPAVLAPELQDLGDLQKATPLSNQLFSLPSSEFVSAGRFSAYLIIVVILVLGSAGYLLLTRQKGRKLIFLALGTVGVAALFCGNRGTLLISIASLGVLGICFLWGAPWRQRQAHRALKSVRRSLVVAGASLALFIFLFPEQAGSRIDYYTETLMPSSSAYQLESRTWSYPIENLEGAFDRPHWILGNGIGTASLGMQYVAKLTHTPPPKLWVEEGFGDMIVEMGILAPFLWIAWGIALLYHSWKVVKQLKQTRFFPLAIAIFWYAFLLIFPLTYGSLSGYQDYICNAYLWLFVGVLFRLPEVLATGAPAIVPNRATVSRGGFQF
ncbi:MAG TPA: hypothetical protein VJR23_17755 [Candidatus Acidoferrales bacterium]|nr:hypothetical protein [Candidatus Acidoferrales bacterium]